MPGQWPIGRVLAAVAAAPLMLAGMLTGFGPPPASAAATSAPACSWAGMQPPNPGFVDNQLKGVAMVSACNVWAVGFSFSAGSAPQTLIEHWNGTSWKVVPSPDPGNGRNELDGVRAVSATNIYAVGSFDTIGAPSQTLIEHYDGTSWQVVKNTPSPGTFVNVLKGVRAVSATDIWAVGTFANSGGPEQTLTLHWNGTAWQQKPSPNPGGSQANNVLCGVAASASNNVWAVGHFFDGTNNQAMILHWNGTKWTTATLPPLGSSSSDLSAVAVTSASNAWAVGSSSTPPNQRTLILRWNGTAWKVAKSPSPGPSGTTNVLNGVAATSASNAWAVGRAGTNSADQTLIEHWNGSTWTRVTSPDPGGPGNTHELFAVAASSAASVWAVGTFQTGSMGQTLAVHAAAAPAGTPACQSWAGGEPSGLPDTETNILHGVTVVSPCNIWAVGESNKNGPTEALIEHWNGSTWTLMPLQQPPNSDFSLFGVSAAAPNDVWAVGEAVDTAVHPLILHWDGSNWTQVPPPSVGSQSVLAAVRAVSSNNVWAVGSFRPSGSSDEQNLIEHWDGTSWQVAPTAPAGTSSDLFSVTATSTGNAWAVGQTFTGSRDETLIEHWNGTTWTRQTSPNPASGANALLSVDSSSASSALAVGFGVVNGAERTLAVRWNGSTWSPVTSPNPAIPGDKELHGVTMISANDAWAVGASFTSDRTITMHWNGTAWTLVPSPNPASFNHLNAVAATGGSGPWAVGDAGDGDLSTTPGVPTAFHCC